jgi:hypothetical protein
MPEKQEVRIAPRPASPNPAERNGSGIRPYELDPELAQIRLAELMIGKLGTPSDISAPFVVRHAIFKSLNHRPPLYRLVEGQEVMVDLGNNTGYDCSLRLEVYNHAERGSVNRDGHYFNNFWAYLMKPKYIINGAGIQGGPLEKDEGQSIVGRVVGWFRGGKKDANNGNNP